MNRLAPGLERYSCSLVNVTPLFLTCLFSEFQYTCRLRTQYVICLFWKTDQSIQSLINLRAVFSTPVSIRVKLALHGGWRKETLTHYEFFSCPRLSLQFHIAALELQLPITLRD